MRHPTACFSEVEVHDGTNVLPMISEFETGDIAYLDLGCGLSGELLLQDVGGVLVLCNPNKLNHGLLSQQRMTDCGHALLFY